MSGILLPGQENKPSDVKIELPSGFSTRRKGEEKKADEPKDELSTTPSIETPASTAAPAAGAGRGQPGIDLLFPPAPVQIRCPNCGTTYTVPLFTIIDLGANPELKGPLLGGQINVAVCPNCGVGGPLSAPLLVHDPEHQFLGIFAPMQAGKADLQQQKAIGDLTQALMRKLPAEARKGYLLQPKQYTDWNRFMEQLWEFEGVSPEMLRRQRNQSELLQRLIALANDPKAMQLAIQQRGSDLLDRDFFALLDRLIVMTSSQGQNAEPLLQLRNQLLESTDVGKQIKQRQDKVRSILQGLGANTTREQLLDTLLAAWQEEDGRDIVSALAMAVAPLLDYQFLMLVSQRLENTTDEEERQRLEELRQLILTIQEQQTQNQQAMVQQIQQVLQQVLQAPDTMEALRQYADYIDENFLSVLAANIQAAQRNNSTAAARRLQQIYEQAMSIVQENLPEEMRLINELLNAPDKAALSRLLQENRPKLNKDFVAALKVLETDMRDAGRSEVADRLKSLRGQISLMILIMSNAPSTGLKAEIVTTGTEILLGEIVDTNAAWIAQQLREAGVNLYYKTTVGDNEARIRGVLELGMNRSDVIICSGGLGPTVDDVTRQAIANAAGRPLFLHEGALATLNERFARFGVQMTENNIQQAYIPEGAILIPNPVGTAPGFIVETERSAIIAVPGVPREMKHLMTETVLPYLRARAGHTGIIRRRVLRTIGIGESMIDATLGELMHGANPTIGLAAHTAQVDVRITARAATPDQAEALLDGLEAQVRDRIGRYIYSTTQAEAYETVVIRQLQERNATLALLETNTRGVFAQRISAAVPGFDPLLTRWVVGVDPLPAGLAEKFIVPAAGELVYTEGLAAECAEILLQQTGATYALALLGTAGADEGVYGTRSGETWLALAGPQGVHTSRCPFGGQDEYTLVRIGNQALGLLQRILNGQSSGHS